MSDSSDDDNDEMVLDVELLVDSGALNFGNVAATINDFDVFKKMAESNNRTLKEVCFKNLYVFACSLAMESIYAHYPRTIVKELWLLIFGNFGNVLEHYDKKDISKRTLACFQNSTWPVGFFDYCAKKHALGAKGVPSKWLSRHKTEVAGVSTELLRSVYFGCKIQKAVENAKRNINNKCNPLYDEKKIPSGLNQHNLLSAIR